MSFFDLALFLALGSASVVTFMLLGVSAVGFAKGSNEDQAIAGAGLRETVLISKGEQTRQVF
ncbi:MAG: hypothetical protein ACYTDT_12220 [Planctomycetota bacterium]|jgi:microcompartment protein CcmK/EutM